jgi:exodeoxyribonuclease V alpha subunit
VSLLADDPFDADLAIGADVPVLLQVFNHAGVLAAADVHAALRLGRLAGETDESILLAVALAVRGPRFGHVSVDLLDVHNSALAGEDDIDLSDLPWPEPGPWVERVSTSPLIGVVDRSPSPPATTEPGAAADGPVGADEIRPVRLSGSALYLDRYWTDEVALASELLARATPDPGADLGMDPGRLERLFPGPGSEDQRAAAAATLGRRLTVLAGGPGTGKTTTVARLLAALTEAAGAAGRRPPLIALAAPTGKAAARMEEAVRAEAGQIDTDPAVREVLMRISSMTIHRLLGTRPDRPGRFRHHAGHRLPHEVVVVDEVSMVALSLMTRLVESVRPDARLILVGDPEQLVSVEAGAVLADIVTPAGEQPTAGEASMPGEQLTAGEQLTVGEQSTPGEPQPLGGPTRAGAGAGPPIRGSISFLRTNHRFSGALSELADAVRRGEGDRAIEVLSADDDAVRWIAVEAGEDGAAAERLEPFRHVTTEWADRVREAATAGAAGDVLAALRAHRVLCAHRRGPTGVALWNRLIEGWVLGDEQGPAGHDWYPGRPVMVTVNDYTLRLWNGDTGVAVSVPGADGDGSVLRVAFEDQSTPGGRLVSPSRLADVDTVFAMTVHKSQGSEFDHVSLVVPPAASRLLTRELLYTGLTRARHRLLVIGTEEAVRAAVARPVSRASGLGHRLWPVTGG